MGNEDFNGQALTEKLSKLNSSQQSVESLSRWCVSFRKKAKQIVETWDKLFKSAQWDQRVAFLFLANDILQTSRRKGSEFVNEFWKVLPDKLKDAHENGGDNGKKVATKLVNVWDERKVFGSRGQNLKDLLGKDSSVPLNSIKSSNPIKIVKKDAHSLRIKLSVGAMPEKILSAFQLVHDDNTNEETAIDKCEGVIYHLEEMEKDVGNFPGQGLQSSELIDKTKEHEDILGQSISQLENAEAIRVVLISHLKEALADQESKLEHLRNKLQVARGGNEHIRNLLQRLSLPSPHPLPANLQQMENKMAVESNMHTTQVANISLVPSSLSVAPVASPKVNEEDSKKAAAAAVAAKLTASTSSAQMLTSILSSLVAEEAASMSSGLKPPGFSTLPFAPPEKRPRLDNNPVASNSSYFANAQQSVVTNMPLGPSLGVQSTSQTTQTQAPFLPPPPPPPTAVGNTPPSQSVQSSGMMMGMMPYTYNAGNLPPQSLPGHTTMGLARPGAQTQPSQMQIQQLQLPQSMQQQQQQQQQQSATGGYYRPPGIGFYGQGNQTATQPAPRQ